MSIPGLKKKKGGRAVDKLQAHHHRYPQLEPLCLPSLVYSIGFTVHILVFFLKSPPALWWETCLQFPFKHTRLDSPLTMA